MNYRLHFEPMDVNLSSTSHTEFIDQWNKNNKIIMKDKMIDRPDILRMTPIDDDGFPIEQNRK